MSNVRLVTIYLFVFVAIVSCQDCVVPGRYCISDEACCGGCCRDNVCINTYDSCILREDPCLIHYCPPGLECYVFKPNCEGCEPRRACKFPKSSWF